MRIFEEIKRTPSFIFDGRKLVEILLASKKKIV